MEPTKDDKLEELDKVLHSRILHGSESLRAFLRFVVEKAVDNQDSLLKEYTIATEVFGRGNDYDSRIDSVVRVQAGRLRTKLQEYYATEGRDDKVLIDLPKGHYAPVFSYAHPNGSAATLHPEPTTSAMPRAVVGGASMVRPWAIGGLVGVSLLLGFFAFHYWSENRRLSAGMNSDPPDMEAALPLWKDLLRSREPILVTFSNTLFQGTAESGMRLLKSLDSPAQNYNLSGGSQGPGQAEQNGGVITAHYTGIGEAMGVYFLADLFSKARHPFRVKRSLLLTWDDLKTENIVVLGSPAENFLLRDLPQKQDFIFGMLKDRKEAASFGVTNTKPRPEEQNVYLAKQEGASRSQISEDYAVISLLQGLDADHRLLILGGITTYGTQAAAEYVSKPEYIRDLVAHLDTAPVGASPRLPAYFQILIKVKVNGGVPVQISYVTHHVL